MDDDATLHRAAECIVERMDKVRNLTDEHKARAEEHRAHAQQHDSLAQQGDQELVQLASLRDGLLALVGSAQEPKANSGEPDSDEALQDSSDQSHTPPAERSCSQMIREIVRSAPSRAWSLRDICDAIPDARRQTVSVTVQRMVQNGEMVRVSRGVYRLIKRQHHVVAGAEAARSSVRDMYNVVQMSESDSWSHEQIATAMNLENPTEAAHLATALAQEGLAQVGTNGYVHKVSFGPMTGGSLDNDT